MDVWNVGDVSVKCCSNMIMHMINITDYVFPGHDHVIMNYAQMFHFADGKETVDVWGNNRPYISPKESWIPR